MACFAEGLKCLKVGASCQNRQMLLASASPLHAAKQEGCPCSQVSANDQIELQPYLHKPMGTVKLPSRMAPVVMLLQFLSHQVLGFKVLL
jgi:hypothetical protein